MKLPDHMSISIEHNLHKNCYEKIEDYLFQEPMLRFKELPAQEFEECIKNNEIWEIHWYPRTPISFHYVCGPTLESCLNKIENNQWD